MIGNKLKSLFRVDPKTAAEAITDQAVKLYPYSSILLQAHLIQLKATNSNLLVKSIQQHALQISNRAQLKNQLQATEVTVPIDTTSQKSIGKESSAFSIDELQELPELTRNENEKDKAIENFLAKAQEIGPIQPKDSNKQNPPTLQSELDLVSETLAQIFVKQGNFQKAIEIYTKLTLKYPEKRDYFAALIKKLK